jgi:hypothetical protein
MNEKTETKKTSTVTCDLYNPTPARRVIYDGITIEGASGHQSYQKSITVEPGETKRGVTISRLIAEELRDRNRAKRDSDLVIKPQTTEAADSGEKTAA